MERATFSRTDKLPQRYKMDISETDIQKSIIEVLEYHPQVAYFWRHNVGFIKRPGRAVRFGIPGQSDILGILKGGRFLAIEIKKPKKDREPEQVKFQDTVNQAGGLAFVARSIDDVIRELG